MNKRNLAIVAGCLAFEVGSAVAAFYIVGDSYFGVFAAAVSFVAAASLARNVADRFFYRKAV